MTIGDRVLIVGEDFNGSVERVNEEGTIIDWFTKGWEVGYRVRFDNGVGSVFFDGSIKELNAAIQTELHHDRKRTQE